MLSACVGRKRERASGWGREEEEAVISLKCRVCRLIVLLTSSKITARHKKKKIVAEDSVKVTWMLSFKDTGCERKGNKRSREGHKARRESERNGGGKVKDPLKDYKHTPISIYM